MEFRGKTVLIAGMALSGVSSAVLLNQLGARIVLYDAKPFSDLSQAAQSALSGLCYEDYLGRDATSVLETADLVVTSPGLPPTLPLLRTARARNIPVISEIELGFQNASGDLIAITGTNGKTTTTALTGAIFSEAGRNTFVLGNIGVPISSRALETRPGDILVVETAALQLDDTLEYKPRACAILNVTPDHLDRYGTMDRYAQAKARIFVNQDSGDFCVLNLDDPIVCGFAEDVPSEILWISLDQTVDHGICLRDGTIEFCSDGRRTPLLPASEVRIPGRHNLQNAMAAAALALGCGVEPEQVAQTLRTFPGVEHRIETVCEKQGVLYVNDSKGTNPDATIKAIEAMNRPIVLILGGYDKHADFTELMKYLPGPVRHVVVLGDTADKITDAARESGWTALDRADTFEAAVLSAAEKARAGDVVLLSPACASWDMFANFEERGKCFKEIVRGRL